MPLQIFGKNITNTKELADSIPLNYKTTFARFPEVIETADGSLDSSKLVGEVTASLLGILCKEGTRTLNESQITNLDGYIVGYDIDENKIYVDKEENLAPMKFCKFADKETGEEEDCGYIALAGVDGPWIPFPQKISPEEEAFLRSLGDE